MVKTVFRIPKMDCLSEERIIRMTLEGVQGIKGLDFLIPERKLTVLHEGNSEIILNALLPLNFGVEISSSAESKEDDIGIPINSEEEQASLLKKLLVINAGMFIVEFAAGLVADSMGLISDSFDMLSDASVYLVSLYAVGKVLSVKKKSARINGIFQLILGSAILVETVRKFFIGSNPESSYMIFISLIALAANVYCLYLLSGHKEGKLHMFINRRNGESGSCFGRNSSLFY